MEDEVAAKPVTESEQDTKTENMDDSGFGTCSSAATTVDENSESIPFDDNPKSDTDCQVATPEEDILSNSLLPESEPKLSEDSSSTNADVTIDKTDLR